MTTNKMREAVAAVPYMLVCGHWKDETYAIHGPNGHIASGIQPAAASALVAELNALATRRALPDGCVAVPVEATPAMLLAARNAECRVFGNLGTHNAAIYAAMLAARPAQAEDPQ